MKPFGWLLIFALLGLFSNASAWSAEPSKTSAAPVQPAAVEKPVIPTGLLQLPDYRYPVFLYVPDNYTPDKEYALIVATPQEGIKIEEAIQYWVSIAKRKSMLVLMPSCILRPGSEPQRMDEWILQILSDLKMRYRIDKQRTYLVGKGAEAAHYASYLAVNFPESFSAVALLGGAWHGYLEPLMKFSSQIRKQPPFFVALEADASPDTVQQIKAKALKLERKGYAIHLVELPKGEGFQEKDFKAQLIDWMNEKSANWYQALSTSKKTFRERFSEWLNRNIQVG